MVLFLVSMWNSALALFNGTWDRMSANSQKKLHPYIDMYYFLHHAHGMHIINPHRRHTNRALTLKCMVHIWTSGGLSVDCERFQNYLLGTFFNFNWSQALLSTENINLNKCLSKSNNFACPRWGTDTQFHTYQKKKLHVDTMASYNYATIASNRWLLWPVLLTM